jgi:LDH2 family malate/lactate/ureidoglycolate dehydrogenase
VRTASAAKAATENLREFASAILRRVGMTAEDAGLLADSLVEADAAGLTTHGTSRLAPYVEQLRSGQVNVSPHETVLVDRPSALLMDADGAFGAPVGIRALDLAMEKARATGLCLVGVTNVAHFGAAGYYTRHAADQGFLALAMSSSSPSVVPFGGRTARIGNSPMSFAAPGESHPELVMDMAQSMTSRGRIRIAMESGDDIPDGWAIDADGNPTTDPREALNGAVLPSGGHKGSAMSLVVEMLASGLTGAHLSQHIQNAGFTKAYGGASATDVTVGNCYLVIDADVFGDAAAVRRRATSIAEYVRSSPSAPGVDGVLAPGDVELQHGRRAAAGGVDVLPSTVEDFHRLSQELGVPLPLLTPREGER